MASNKKGVYISFIHFRKPIPESKQVQVTESCDIIDKITNYHERSSTAIIDVLGKCFYKNRTSDISYERMMHHFEQTYPRQKQALDMYLKEHGYITEEEQPKEPVGVGPTVALEEEQPKKKAKKKKDETQVDSN